MRQQFHLTERFCFESGRNKKSAVELPVRIFGSVNLQTARFAQ
jgi:hypothetical protein